MGKFFLYLILIVLTIGCVSDSDIGYTKNSPISVFTAEFAFNELGARNAAIVGIIQARVFNRNKREEVFNELADSIIEKNPDVIFLGDILLEDDFSVVENL